MGLVSASALSQRTDIAGSRAWFRDPEYRADFVWLLVLAVAGETRVAQREAIDMAAGDYRLDQWNRPSVVEHLSWDLHARCCYGPIDSDCCDRPREGAPGWSARGQERTFLDHRDVKAGK